MSRARNQAQRHEAIIAELRQKLLFWRYTAGLAIGGYATLFYLIAK